MKLEEVLPAFRDGKKIKSFGVPHSDGFSKDEHELLIPVRALLGEWEVEIPKVTITLTDLEKAWEKTGREGKSPVVQLLAHELGLI